ncbi:hypothetical protein [Clostridium cylindrosporum]|uniref:Glycosyl transferase family 2 n=1 Tax=Clostridium cylindrosporum DSM 605 TaxID=1121307 RepID=A0A0J8DDA3_CLOCY|nr:hypothetical protein [Clostridium cylindrosporum]KMT22219.1 glycosyl transferase family 2 [Clostridium cylindrosporum DSM 605]
MSPIKYIKIIVGILISTILIGLFYYTSIFPMENKCTHKNLIVEAKTSGKDIVIKNKDNFEKIFLKGVNIGVGKPGYFPNEFGITKAEYLRWFNQIYAMNANVIRVYTLLSPDFYEALYEFNRGKDKPLYIIHGIWVNENNIEDTMNGFSFKIKNHFIRDIQSTINVIHGRAYIPPNGDYSSGRYTKDVSKYVLGYILGIEWDGNFVQQTDLFNEDKTSYKGNYLYTVKGASPFEVLLAEVGDFAIKYETENYKHQRLIAFSNWPTTDPLDHPYEPEEYNTIGSVDTEKIKSTSNFKSGMFASYHVYPYYPDFLNLDPKYNAYRDEKGRKNSYRAYLNDLIKYHSIPVVISEFGIPTSRGLAHVDESRGYNHGNVNEFKQANATADLYDDIVKSGSSGAIIFSWQDEWFKKSWNVMDGIDLERAAYWQNAQTSEQNYGILAFDPGKERVKSYPDGDISEWKESDIVTKDKDSSLSITSDEKYIYMKVYKKGLDINRDKIYIPLDITPKSGAVKSSLLGLNFTRGVDFVIKLDGKYNSRVYVHDYYNPLLKDKSPYPEDEKYTEKYSKDMDKFNKIYLTIRHEITVGPNKKKYKPIHFETGKLIYGNANINSKNYNSLSDFYVSDDNIEIRLPWQLLNFSDPSKRKVRGDIMKSINPSDVSVRGIYSSLIIKTEKNEKSLGFGMFRWSKWNKPDYHERLKPVYYKMREVFGK